MLRFYTATIEIASGSESTIVKFPGMKMPICQI